MSKAILVIDMPDDCEDCRFHYCTRDDYDEPCDMCELLEGVVMDGYTDRYQYCPLKAIPEKMEICGVYNSEYYAKGGRMPSWKCGWNACIDEFLKGEEHETD